MNTKSHLLMEEHNMLTVQEFAKHLDLAYLSPNLQEKDIIEACNIKKYKVANVNVNSYWAELVVKELEGSGVGPSAVIGFLMEHACQRLSILSSRRWLTWDAQPAIW